MLNLIESNVVGREGLTASESAAIDGLPDNTTSARRNGKLLISKDMQTPLEALSKPVS
jgi:hypothetical protein